MTPDEVESTTNGVSHIMVWMRLPIAITIFVSVIYCFELYLAGSLAFGAPYSYITSLPAEYTPYVLVLSPFLHSNHTHFLWNIVFFLFFSAYARTHIHEGGYFGIVLLTSYLTAITPFIFGKPSIGMSGTIAALGGWAMVYHGHNYVQALRNISSLGSVNYWGKAVLFILPATFTIAMFAQPFGLVEVSSGVSTVGHASGAFYGVAIGLVVKLNEHMEIVG